MIILGVDPGTRFSGYAVLKKEERTLQLLDYGFFAFSAQKTLPERIFEFHEKFDLLITKKQITCLALETPFLGKNAQNFLKLGYLRGVLYLLAEKYKIKTIEFSPREIKQTVTGFGGASKEQVAFMVARLVPNISQQVRFDVTDALAVGLCAAWSVQNPVCAYTQSCVPEQKPTI